MERLYRFRKPQSVYGMRIAQESGKVGCPACGGRCHLGRLGGGNNGGNADRTVKMRQFLTACDAALFGASLTRLGRHGSNLGPFLDSAARYCAADGSISFHIVKKPRFHGKIAATKRQK
ncbi:MAG: hypothetical protein IOC90_12445 [Methylocystis sp.]|nr:hypothetical protein [Methylocystis sp.]MCA3583338.1 hypothetical protein [Methylocystis sp.]MCA3588825.1 hypothetical protein [Methylocystis sp.]MCA3591857.1 hypothetical protein [Methylocystis sp.]